MVTALMCEKRFGPPTPEFERMWMSIWAPSPGILALPRRIYCHRFLLEPLHQVHDNILDAKLAHEIRTWDGCFNIRLKKGGMTRSLHSWGLAIDLNAAWNQYNTEPTMSQALVQCFTTAGFTWGGIWQKPKTDGMHFELTKLPT